MNETLELFADFKSASAYAKTLALKFKESPTVVRVAAGYAILASDSLMAKIRKSSAVHDVSSPTRGEPIIPKLPRTTSVRKVTHKKSATLTKTAVDKSLAPSIGRMTKDRFSKMTSEIRAAYNTAPASIMNEWANYTLSLLASAFVRRVKNVVNLGIVVMEKVGREIINFAFAIFDGKVSKHVARRSQDISEATSTMLNECTELLKSLVSSFRKNPGEVGPDILIASLAFAFASGGLDGDGGVPDSDIAMFGIDAHRSIFTHSIVSGAVIEAGLYSMVDFISRAYAYLPKNHDPLWDTMHKKSAEAAELAAKGVSVGLAYHFGVDAVLQPAAYHDLPFPAPIEAHQTIMGANAVGEGIDAKKKSKASVSSSRTTPGPTLNKARDIAGIAVAGAIAGTLMLMG